jgi:23S rRNA pseudouridine1911/1915/1917 synthase
VSEGYTYRSFIAGKNAARLDVFLASVMPEFSRSFFLKVIKEGGVTVDGGVAQAKTKPKEGSVVCVKIDEPEPVEVEKEDIPIDIVYEDDAIVIVNKKQGMVVHPAAGNATGTLANALLFHVKDLSDINGKLRPGIVHRIDKNTSGLIAVAKTDAAHISLSEQIAEKQAGRVYTALVYGNVKEDAGRIDAPIARHKTDRKRMAVVSGGKHAVTNYEVLERFKGYTLIKAKLETGRTHQIRVHFNHIGHSVMGDPQYGRKKHPFQLNGQLLHASELSLTHPKTGERMTFEAKLPEYFTQVIELLRKTKPL